MMFFRFSMCILLSPSDLACIYCYVFRSYITLHNVLVSNISSIMDLSLNQEYCNAQQEQWTISQSRIDDLKYLLSFSIWSITLLQQINERQISRPQRAS